MRRSILLLIAVILEDRVADGNALIADIGAWVILRRRDQFTNNILAFMAKRATEGIVGAGTLHGISCTKGIEVSYASQYTRLFGSGMPDPYNSVSTTYNQHYALRPGRSGLRRDGGGSYPT